MADLNIRNIDPQLMIELKAAALRSNTTLRDFCLAALANVAYPETAADERIKNGSWDRMIPLPPTLPIAGTINGVNQHHHPACKCGVCCPPKA